MSIWERYESRVCVNGTTQRDEVLNREKMLVMSRTKNSLSYHNVFIEGVERKVSIINSDNLNEKVMFSLPGEDFNCGDVVDWANNHWLISEKDANNEVCTRVKLIQCNYVLKWIDSKHQIHEQWCVIEDGTKLRRIYVRYSLAHWKRCVKTTPLIAGNSLEPYKLQRGYEIRTCVNVKNYMDWTISSQDPNRVRFNDYLGSENKSKRSETGSPKSRNARHGEDIVCALSKDRGVRNCTGKA